MNFADAELKKTNGHMMLESPSFQAKLSPEASQLVAGYQGPPQVRVGIRPESISASMSPITEATQASVYLLEPQGERTILGAKLTGGEFFLVEVPPDFEAELDETVYLKFREPIHIFNLESGLNLLYA